MLFIKFSKDVCKFVADDNLKLIFCTPALAWETNKCKFPSIDIGLSSVHPYVHPVFTLVSTLATTLNEVSKL